MFPHRSYVGLLGFWDTPPPWKTSRAVSAATSLATGEASPSLITFKGIQVGKECIGTPCNMAPEVFDRKYGPMCDMWSFGCVLYELLLGEPLIFCCVLFLSLN